MGVVEGVQERVDPARLVARAVEELLDLPFEPNLGDETFVSACWMGSERWSGTVRTSTYR